MSSFSICTRVRLAFICLDYRNSFYSINLIYFPLIVSPIFVWLIIIGIGHEDIDYSKTTFVFYFTSIHQTHLIHRNHLAVLWNICRFFAVKVRWMILTDIGLYINNIGYTIKTKLFNQRLQTASITLSGSQIIILVIQIINRQIALFPWPIFGSLTYVFTIAAFPCPLHRFARWRQKCTNIFCWVISYLIFYFVMVRLILSFVTSAIFT